MRELMDSGGKAVSVLNVTRLGDNNKKSAGRRGQPQRMSKLQREIIAFHSRHPDTFVRDGFSSWYSHDPFARVLNKIFVTEDGGYVDGISGSSYYRSRKNLIAKGYLEMVVREKNGQVAWGYRLTDKAVAEFLGGDRNRQLPPGELLAWYGFAEHESL